MKSIIKRSTLLFAIATGCFTAAYAYPPGTAAYYRPRSTIVVTPARQQRTVDVNVIGQSITYLQEAKRVNIRHSGDNSFNLIMYNEKNRLFWVKSRGVGHRGAMGISQFVNATWFDGPLSLANIPPQAILIGSTSRNGKAQFIAVFKLSNPTYNANRNITRYNANLVFNNTTYNLNGLNLYDAKLIIG